MQNPHINLDESKIGSSDNIDYKNSNDIEF